MTWTQLSVITDENSAPDIADYFSELGAVSVTFMDAEDKPVYEPPLNEVKVWQSTKVIALFELEYEPSLIKNVVNEQFKHKPLQDWREERLEDQAWERTWLDHYQPMLFGKRLWVCPTGMTQSEPGTVCMTLDPGLAFGTGTHPTTALCLEWLASHDLKGKTIIDYGCGSGILAVAAILLGAQKAHAIDIDPQALTATTMNAEKNAVQDRITCYLPEEFSPTAADVVLANILASPLIKLSNTIAQLVKPTGALVLSGILTEQVEQVRVAYQPLIDFSETTVQDEWCRLDGIRY
jgi:ribosomal protein L11 methyltransferase